MSILGCSMIQIASSVQKQISKMSIVRKVVFGFLCIAIAFGMIAKCVFLHRVSQYQKGKRRLELYLQKDERFRNVRIFFYSTRPSASVLAPRDLPLNAKQDLERLVTAAFGQLAVPVQYAGAQYFENANGVSNGESNQVRKGDTAKQP
jgi:hypothetical protein